MDQNEAPNNVIQFPGKKKDAEETQASIAAPIAQAASTKQPQPRMKGSKASKRNKPVATLAGAVLAIMLATGASNRYAFQAHNVTEFSDLSSNLGVSRGIASVESSSWRRDADWEKQLGERLASQHSRLPASFGIGHEATLDEKLCWGTLEQKYTIVYKPEARRQIQTIELQDPTTSPAYILDRAVFLKKYGGLLDQSFASAQLKSVEMNQDITVEQYTLLDKDQRPKGEVHFELDKHKRLLSLKVKPTQI